MTYSASGIGQMSRNFHKFTRAHILPPDKTEHRPVVLNSWEAVFFDIDEKVLIDFARESRKYGIDMLVMDDGWFGKRVNDRAGLGDWFENRERFPDGLKAFAEPCEGGGRRLRHLDRAGDGQPRQRSLPRTSRMDAPRPRKNVVALETSACPRYVEP